MSTYIRNNNNINRKKSRVILCTNCGSRGHEYKQCSEPVTSWGIILVNYANLNKPAHNKKINLLNNFVESRQRVLVKSNNDRLIISKAYSNLTFLMISRKHSLGYVEFIRGRYRPDKTDQVIYLFKQMMEKEIEKIKKSLTMDDGFEYLWRDFWGNKHDNPYLSKDRSISFSRYNMLKYTGVDGPEIDLKYIVSAIKVDYDTEEWGFPKGRRNKIETVEECAIREFKEESGYTDDDIEIIHEIEPLTELFTGTNGIEYRHIYYVAELISGKPPQNNITESQINEVGNIQFMNFENAIHYIRDYHVPRKQVLESVFTYYIDKLILSNRNDDNESDNKDMNENNFQILGDEDDNSDVDDNIDNDIDDNIDNDVDDNVINIKKVTPINILKRESDNEIAEI